MRRTNGNPELARKTERSDSGPRDAVTRRRKIVDWMSLHKGPVHGSELAQHFRISRQCLVQDVAILRASGREILSTPQGYLLPRSPSASSEAHRAILACKHGPDRTEEELNILVDQGVKVLDVLVEHPLYGELRGSLMISSRADVADFMRRWREGNASLLSSLTDGVHLHTVETSKRERIDAAKAQLQDRGILLR